MKDDYTKALEAVLVDLIGMRSVEGIMRLTGRPENVCTNIRKLVDDAISSIAEDTCHKVKADASLVKSLRDSTGAGLHTCKQALEHYNLDYDKAFSSISGGKFVRKDL